jgi:hypothetical protein
MKSRPPGRELGERRQFMQMNLLISMLIDVKPGANCDAVTRFLREMEPYCLTNWDISFTFRDIRHEVPAWQT